MKMYVEKLLEINVPDEDVKMLISKIKQLNPSKIDEKFKADAKHIIDEYKIERNLKSMNLQKELD